MRAEVQAGHLAIQKFNLAVPEQQLQNSGVKMPEMKRPGGPVMIPAGTSASHSLDDSREKLGHFLNSWPNEGNAPHLIKRAYDQHQEPEPYAHTDYTWTSENQIPDLQRHITLLIEKRQKFAGEAESLWRLLAEDEAHYYNMHVADDETKLGARKLVENLGNIHADIWCAISNQDWMIADARKRTAQLKSAQSNAEGKVSWRFGNNGDSPKPDLTESLLLLSTFEGEVRDRKAALKATRDQLQQSLQQIATQKGDEAAEQKRPAGIGGLLAVWKPQQGPDRQALESYVKKIDDLLKVAEFDAESCRKQE